MVLNARTLSWSSGRLYRKPQKRHKRGGGGGGVSSPYGRGQGHGSGRGRGGGAAQGRDLPDRQPQLQLAQRLLMPISRWIPAPDRADMMAALFTLAGQAATYQAGIPTRSWGRETRGRRLCVAVEGLTLPAQDGVGWAWGGGAYTPPARPQQPAPPIVQNASLVSRLPGAARAHK